MNRIRAACLVLLYYPHLKIRVVHDKTYQSLDWYKKWSDKGYSHAVHRAALVSFILSFVIFNIAQSLWPYLFSLKPNQALAGTNTVTWTSAADFNNNASTTNTATTKSNVSVADSVTLNSAFGLNYGFGDDYSITSNPSSSSDGLNDIASDGTSIYLAGSDYTPGNNSAWRIEKRDKVTGELVTAFGTNGVISTNLKSVISVDEETNKILIDGQDLYLVGFDKEASANNYSEFRIEKRNKDTGALINGFGTNGVVKYFPPGLSAVARAAAFDASYIYVAGWVQNSAPIIVKYSKSNGAVDNNFGVSGYKSRTGGSSGDQYKDLVVEGTSIYAVSSYDVNGQWCVEKLNTANGALDTSFGGGNGYVLIDPAVGVGNEFVTSIEIDGDSIYVAGQEGTNFPVKKKWRVEKRSKSTGAAVGAFGTNGVLTFDYNIGEESSEVINDIKISGGALYITGVDVSVTNGQLRVEKRDATTGAAVTAFGTNGAVVQDMSAGADNGRAMLIDNSSLFIGISDTAPGNTQWRLQRRNVATGVLDKKGYLTTEPSANKDYYADTASDATYVYLLGSDSALGASNAQWRLEKRNISDGALVAGFGTNGVVVSNPGTGNDFARSITADDNYIYLAGEADNHLSDTKIRLEKRNKSDGALVNTFGTNGVLTINPNAGTDGIGSILVNSGYLYLGGYSGGGVNGMSFFEKRNTNDGALATEFGTNGTILYDYGNWPPSETVSDIIATAEYLYIGITSNNMINDEYTEGTKTILKLNTNNGSIANNISETTYGANGLISLAIDSNYLYLTHGRTLEKRNLSNLGLAYQVNMNGNTVYYNQKNVTTDSNYIYVATAVSNSGLIEKRNLSDGSLDTTFGTNGMYTYNPTNGNDQFVNVVVSGSSLLFAGVTDSETTGGWTVVKQSATYISPGTISALKINSGAGAKSKWNTVSWNSVTLPANTAIKFRARTSDDNSTWSGWSSYFNQTNAGTTIGSGDISSLSASQYLELEMTLESITGDNAPTLSDFTISYDSIDIPTNLKTYKSDGTDISTIGNYTNESIVNLKADLGIPMLGGSPLAPEFEVRTADSGWTGSPAVPTGVISTPTNVTYTCADNPCDSLTNQAVGSFSGLLAGTTYYWKVRTTDAAGRVSPWSATSTVINIDQTPPTISAFAINNGDQYTSTGTATLSITAADTGGSNLSHMRFSNDGTTWTDWETYNTSKANYSLSAGEGTKTVYAQVKDTSGNVSGQWMQTSQGEFDGGNKANVQTTDNSLTLSVAESNVNKTLTINSQGEYAEWPAYVGSNHCPALIGSNEGSYLADHDGISHREMCNIQDSGIPINSTINSVTIYGHVMTLGPLNRIYLGVRSGTSDSWGAEIDPVDNADFFRSYSRPVLNTNPITGNAWTVSEINSLQIGIKTNSPRDTNFPNILADYSYAVINYSSPPITSGTFTSSTRDNTTAQNYGKINWSANIPSQTGADALRFQVASNNDNSTWNFVGPDGTAGTYYTTSGTQLHSSHNGHRYIKYKAYLQTADAAYTPTVYDVSIEANTTTSDQITFDTQAPTGTVTINQNNPGYTNNKAVTLYLDPTNPEPGGSGIKEFQLSNDGITWGTAYNPATGQYSGTWQTWNESYRGSGSGYSWNMIKGVSDAGTDGSRTVYVKYKDNAGNLGGNHDGSWINGSGPLSGIQVKNSDLVGTYTWGPNGSCPTGTNQPCANGIDSFAPSYNGFVSPQAYPSVSFDSYPGQNACKLVNGRLPNYSELRNIYENKSTYGTFQDATYMSSLEYSANTIWGLNFSGGGSETSKVANYYVRCVRDPGTILPSQQPISDSISLDTVAPSASSVSNISTNPNNTGNQTVTWGNFSDASPSSNFQKYVVQRKPNGGAYADTRTETTQGTLTYADNANLAEGTYYYRIVAYDNAGNSTASTDSTVLTVDKTAPTGTVSINGGASYATSADVTLTLSASDTGGSNLSQMRFSNDGNTWSDWETYNTTKAWTLSANDGLKNVFVQFNDVGGNIGGNTLLKKKPLTINNFQANYQINISVDYDNDMQADFGDIRFYDETAATYLPYWVESKTDGVTAVVWVKTGSNNNISLVYGDPSASSLSNGNDTFLLFEDFEGSEVDTNKWTKSGSGTVSNGIYSSAGLSVLESNLHTTQNMIVEVRANILSGAANDIEFGWGTGSWRWQSWDSGGYKSICGSNDLIGKWANSGWKNYKFIRNGTEASLYVDDIQFYQTVNMACVAGDYNIYFTVDNTDSPPNNLEEIDRIIARSYASVVPSVNFGSEVLNSETIILDTTPPNNVANLKGYTNSGKGTELSSGTWYPHNAPYFEWNANGDSDLAGYKYCFDASATCIPETTTANTNWTVFPVLAETGTKYFRIVAYDAAGQSSTTPATFISRFDDAVPGAVTGFTASSNDLTRVNLSWNAVSDGGAPVENYKIERVKESTYVGNSWNLTSDWSGGDGYAVFTVTQASFADDSQNPAQGQTAIETSVKYVYRIRVKDASNAAYSVPQASAVYGMTRDAVPPSDPMLNSQSATACDGTETYCSNIANKGFEIKLTWSPSTDTGTGVSKYNIYRASSAPDNPASFLKIGEVNHPGVIFYDNDSVHVDPANRLNDYTTYYYRVTASDSATPTANESDLLPAFDITINTDSATTPDVTAPSVPTNLTATPMGLDPSGNRQRIAVSWTASTDVKARSSANGSGVKEYKLYRSTSENGEYSLVTTTANTSYNDDDLEEFTYYYYKVKAVDNATVANESALSGYANCRTASNAIPTVPTSVNVTSKKGDPNTDSEVGDRATITFGGSYSKNCLNNVRCLVKYEIYRATTNWANAADWLNPAKATKLTLSATGLKNYIYSQNGTDIVPERADDDRDNTYTIVDTGLTDATTYYYKVRAIDNTPAEPDGGPFNSALSQITVGTPVSGGWDTTPDATKPAIPAGGLEVKVRDTHPNDTELRNIVTWLMLTGNQVPARNGSSDFAKYEVWREIYNPDTDALISTSKVAEKTAVNENYYTDTVSLESMVGPLFIKDCKIKYYVVIVDNAGTDFKYPTNTVINPSYSNSSAKEYASDSIIPSKAKPSLVGSVSVSNVQVASATISWTTDQDADSIVQFRPQGSSGDWTIDGQVERTISHTVNLKGLLPNTSYEYQVISRNYLGNNLESTGTLPALTTNGFNISTGDVVTTTSTAEINWSTNLNTSSAFVEFQLQRQPGDDAQSGTSGVSLEQLAATPRNHKVIVKGLRSNRTYTYKIKSISTDGFLAETGFLTFKSRSFDSEQFTLTPSSSNVAERNITATTAQIIWQTAMPTTSWVDYSTKPGVYDISSGNNDLTTQHVVVLEGLTPGNIYYYRVRVKDANEVEYTSQEYTFRAVLKPKISNLRVTEVTPYTATIEWETNVETETLLNWGKTTGYGEKKGKNEMTKIHRIKVENLDDNTEYHYQIVAKDESGNEVADEDKILRTPLDTEGPKITDVKTDILPMGENDETATVIISWKTNKPATTQVQYDEGIIGNKMSGSTTEDPSLNLSHSVIIRELTAGTTYRFRVVSADKRSNKTISNDFNFMTPSKEKSILQLIVKSLEETFGWIKNIGQFFSKLGKKTK